MPQWIKNGVIFRTTDSPDNVQHMITPALEDLKMLKLSQPDLGVRRFSRAGKWDIYSIHNRDIIVLLPQIRKLEELEERGHLYRGRNLYYPAIELYNESGTFVGLAICVSGTFNPPYDIILSSTFLTELHPFKWEAWKWWYSSRPYTDEHLQEYFIAIKNVNTPLFQEEARVSVIPCIAERIGVKTDYLSQNTIKSVWTSSPVSMYKCGYNGSTQCGLINIWERDYLYKRNQITDYWLYLDCPEYYSEWWCPDTDPDEEFWRFDNLIPGSLVQRNYDITGVCKYCNSAYLYTGGACSACEALRISYGWDDNNKYDPNNPDYYAPINRNPPTYYYDPSLHTDNYHYCNYNSELRYSGFYISQYYDESHSSIIGVNDGVLKGGFIKPLDANNRVATYVRNNGFYNASGYWMMYDPGVGAQAIFLYNHPDEPHHIYAQSNDYQWEERVVVDNMEWTLRGGEGNYKNTTVATRYFSLGPTTIWMHSIQRLYGYDDPEIPQYCFDYCIIYKEAGRAYETRFERSDHSASYHKIPVLSELDTPLFGNGNFRLVRVSVDYLDKKITLRKG